MGGIEFHYHQCCAMKNFQLFLNLKVWFILEVQVLWTRLSIRRSRGSNSNLSFYFSIIIIFSNL
jgi:hypothetical protein